MRDPSKKKDAKEIFQAAIEYYLPHQWEGYIHDACGDDEALRQKVRGLLDAHRQTDHFFDDKRDGQGEPLDVSERPGSQIGPYKLLQEIGEGGFGVVYMAEQLEPVRRKVALKIIKPGMDTKQVIARFEAERQALALMDHPNIARVLDAGSTESGRPYFVMELVKGVPVTEYCDKNNLNTNDRLALFVQVCRAVQHAHQKGVIHRDLKPSNVMVTLHDGHPVPKVIDFGVSKAISQQLTEKTLFTAYGQMIGTPQYMSPEQAEMSGLDVDTRSDVYSLGVLLYELLTGTTPIGGERLKTLAYLEMQRVIREEEPPRPSHRISTMGGELTVLAKHRSTDPKRLTQRLRGDLDWIVMKALSKERTRRYESPSSFAADIERHLADEATEARPPSTAYQVRRFVRRYKGPVAAAATVLLVLLIGIAGTTTGLLRARREANRALVAQEKARQSELAARVAEADARNNLEKSEGLAEELSRSMVKLSENASRLALQRAHTLIADHRSEAGLHWLSRALDLAPDGETPLTREIRTTMAVVAATLPQPRFVVASGKDQTFSSTAVSPDRSHVVQLVSSVPPASPEAIEAHVRDASSGRMVTTVDVPPSTRWVGFTADSKFIYSYDGKSLHLWNAGTGTRVGPAADISKAFASPAPLRLIERMEERVGLMPEGLLQALMQRIRPIIDVGPDGKSVLYQKRFLRDAPPDGSPPAGLPSGDGARQTGGFSGGRSALALHDLRSGTDTLISDDAGIQLANARFAREGQWIVCSALNRTRTTVETMVKAWDVAAGKWVDDWEIRCDGFTTMVQFDKTFQRVALVSRDLVAPGAELSQKVHVYELAKPDAPVATFPVVGSVNRLAVSASGRWAAIETSVQGEQPHMTVWDTRYNRSRTVPLWLERNDNRFGAFSTRNSNAATAAGQIEIAADDATLLLFSGDRMVGWKLPSETRWGAELATAGPIHQFQYAGKELRTLTARIGGQSRGRFGGGPGGFAEGRGGFAEGRGGFGTGGFAGGGPGFRGAPSGLRRNSNLMEMRRWDLSRQSPVGEVIPVSCQLAAVSPDGRHLVTADGNDLQRWSLDTLSKIGEPMRIWVGNGQITHLEFVARGKHVAVHQQLSWRGRRRPTSTGAGREPTSASARSARSPASAEEAFDRISYNRIGVTLAPGPSDRGLLITGITPESPAEAAGMQEDDLLLRMGDQEINSPAMLGQLIDSQSEPELTLVVQRHGVEQTVRLTATPRLTSEVLSQIESKALGTVRLWDVENGEPIGPIPIPMESSNRGGFTQVSDNRWAAVAPDGRIVVVASPFRQQTELRVFDTESGRPLLPSVVYERPIRWIEFDPQGQVLVTLDDRSALQLWDPSQLRPIETRIRPLGTVSCLTFTPDGSTVIVSALSSGGPQLSLWDTRSARRLCPPIPMPASASRMVCDPQGQWLAVADRQSGFWLLPLPSAWEGQRDQMRDLVEVMTGTSLSEGGNVDALEPASWESRLAALPAHLAAEMDGQPFDSPALSLADRRQLTSLISSRAPPNPDGQEARFQALEEHPEAWPLRISHVGYLLTDSRFDEAASELDRALQYADRQQVVAWLKRQAGSTRTRGAGIDPEAHQRSMWCLDQVLKIAPKDTTALMEKTVLCCRGGSIDDARACFDQILQSDAKHFALDAIASLLASSLVRERTLVELMRARGTEISGAEPNVENLAQLLDWIVDAQPRDWRPLTTRVNLALADGRSEDARADLERLRKFKTAAQIDAALQRIEVRGSLLVPFSSRERPTLLERTTSSASHWDLIAEVFPNNMTAVDNAASSWARVRHWEPAAKRLRQMAEAQPENELHKYQLAVVLLKLGRTEEYQALCRDLLEQFDDSAETVKWSRAVRACLWRDGAVEETQQLVDRLKAVFDDGRFELYYRQGNLGLAHLRNGSASEAIEWLERSLKTEPQIRPTHQVRTLAALALAYHAQGDQAQAEPTLQRAIELYDEEAPEVGVRILPMTTWHDWPICELLLEEAKIKLGLPEQAGS